MPKSFSRRLPAVITRIFGPPPKAGAPPEFSEDELVCDGGLIKVTQAWQHYIPLYANTAAIVTTDKGDLVPVNRDNYPELPLGEHRVQYIDLQERTERFVRIASRSKESYEVWLTVTITYQVVHPRSVLQKQNPVQTFRSACDAAIKGVIRAYSHDDLVSAPDHPQVVDAILAEDIKQSIAHNQSCRGFAITQIDILDRQGDPQVHAIQRQRHVDVKALVSELEVLPDKKRLRTEEQTLIAAEAQLDIQRAENKIALERMRAHFEAQKAEILKETEFLKAQLEIIRKLPEMQHEHNLKTVDVRLEALKTLIEAQRLGGFPRNFDDMQLVQQIVSDLPTPTQLPATSMTRLRAALETMMSGSQGKIISG